MSGIPESALAVLRSAHPTIAIDGPSGSGKSTVARALANLLQGDYVDTGATYRAMTWWMLGCDIDLANPEAIAAHADDPMIELGIDPNSPVVWVDAQDVTVDIRTPEVSSAVSRVAAVPAVRRRMVSLQRAYAETSESQKRAVVMEGRDISSVVLPGADVKVWLTADLDARAARRAAQDSALLGSVSDVSGVAQGLSSRDQADSTRADTPVQIDPDAQVVDATHLNVEQTVSAVIRVALEQMGLTHE